MEKVINEIAKAANVSPDAVCAVLGQLGMEQTLDKIKDNFGEDIVTKLTVADLTISARVAGLLVAR